MVDIEVCHLVNQEKDHQQDEGKVDLSFSLGKA
jgi:hypothetical protein